MVQSAKELFGISIRRKHDWDRRPILIIQILGTKNLSNFFAWLQKHKAEPQITIVIISVHDHERQLHLEVSGSFVL